MNMCEKGVLTGHKLSGIVFNVVDGSSHSVDSSEYSFQLAAEGAMRQGALITPHIYKTINIYIQCDIYS